MRMSGVGSVIALLLAAGRSEPGGRSRSPCAWGSPASATRTCTGSSGGAGPTSGSSAIAEPNRELAERYAKRYGLDEALLYASLEEMLARAKPEAVAAFGPTDEHRAVVEACAPRGIHVMVEKPLAFDPGRRSPWSPWPSSIASSC